jgi:hypothetical protein
MSVTGGERMRLLFDGRLAPIASTIGFLEQPLDRTVAAYWSGSEACMSRRAALSASGR